MKDPTTNDMTSLLLKLQNLFTKYAIQKDKHSLEIRKGSFCELNVSIYGPEIKGQIVVSTFKEFMQLPFPFDQTRKNWIEDKIIKELEKLFIEYEKQHIEKEAKNEKEIQKQR